MSELPLKLKEAVLRSRELLLGAMGPQNGVPASQELYYKVNAIVEDLERLLGII